LPKYFWPRRLNEIVWACQWFWCESVEQTTFTSRSNVHVEYRCCVQCSQ
jgi:hypothetical protein